MKIPIVVNAIEHGYGKYFGKKVAEFGSVFYTLLRIFTSHSVYFSIFRIPVSA